MRPALKIALIFAATWIVLKLLFTQLGWFETDITVPGLINNFLLLGAISIGLYLEKKKEGFYNGNALSDVKSAMLAGAPYALIVSAFLYFYYDRINPEFVEHRVEELSDRFYMQMQRDSYVDSLKLQNPDIAELTNEEILRKNKEEVEKNLNPYSTFIFSLLGLIVMAFTYALLVTLIYRKILFRGGIQDRK